jgi:nucleotide-binding universal stress UspA family protein
MFRKILVAVDSSQQSNAALAIAIDLAQRYQASLCLLHAFAHVSDLLGTPQYRHLLEARSVLGQQVLDSARTQVGDAVPVDTQLIEGPAAPAILRVTVEDGCDMIVMGSRGQGQLAGLLLGSVSSAVAQRAECPVLIVH